MKQFAIFMLSGMLLVSNTSYSQERPAQTLTATAQDHQQIQQLLDNYTRAVSTKNQDLFESLLLSKQIPFSYVGEDNPIKDPSSISAYEGFRKGVFEGKPVTQSFEDVNIVQDGNLANVQLIFINKTATSTSWGWKTLQLIKVNGTWKIASEFFTIH